MCTCPPTNTPSQPKISPKIKMCFSYQPCKGCDPSGQEAPKGAGRKRNKPHKMTCKAPQMAQIVRTRVRTRTRTRTRVRALNVTLPHPVGVWYRNPERVPVYNQPFGVGMHPVEGCIPVPVGYRLRAGSKPWAYDRATTKRKAAAYQPP